MRYDVCVISLPLDEQTMLYSFVAVIVITRDTNPYSPRAYDLFSTRPLIHSLTLSATLHLPLSQAQTTFGFT